MSRKSAVSSTNLCAIQTAMLGTVEAVYKPLALVEQNYLKFEIPGDSDTYIDLNIHRSR